MSKILDKGKRSIEHFESDYKQFGLSAQRMYPNEALCRFLGSSGYFAALNKSEIKILEVGCGSGGNLWMLAKEGFDVYGIDSSETAIELCKTHLFGKWNVKAELQVAMFDNLPYQDDFFDVVVDVVSLQHLDLEITKKAFAEIYRVLKPGGAFFSYRLSDGSCMYMNSGGDFEDAATVNNIYPRDLPLNNNQRISFWSPSISRMYYEDSGFTIKSIEKDTRTYQNMKMSVEYLAIIAEKE